MPCAVGSRVMQLAVFGVLVLAALPSGASIEILKNCGMLQTCGERTITAKRFPTIPCHCDAECSIYGDCCIDKVSSWPSDQLAPIYNVSKELWSCKAHNFRKESGTSSLPELTYHYVVSACPQADSEHSALCSHNLPQDHSFLLDIPAVSAHTGISYSNVYCAACHGDNFNMHPVRVSVSCSSPGITRHEILACVSAILAFLLAGCIVGYSAVLIPQLEYEDSDIPVTVEQTSWIASLAVIPVPFTAPLTGYIIDTFGRLTTIYLAIIPYIVGWICIATAQSVPAIYVGRILTGLAVSTGPGAAIVYTTEVARPDLRGVLMVLGPVLTSCGILLTYIEGAFLHWRTIAWINVGTGLLPLVSMALFSPESPAYFVAKKKNEKALKSLLYLSRMGEHTGTPEEQLATIIKEYEAKSTVGNAFTKLIKGCRKPTAYKPFIILVLLFFFQQYSGGYVTLYYAVTLFQDVGSSLDTRITSIAVGLVRVLVGLLTSCLLRKFGRRPLLMISGLGMAIMVSISGYFSRLIITGEANADWMHWVPAIAILLYLSFNVLGLMTIPWTMSAEMFPLELRGFLQGLILGIAHLLMFSVLYLYRHLTILLGGAYVVQWCFAVISLLSTAFIWLLLPETHLKTLIEIQDYFDEKGMIYPLRK